MKIFREVLWPFVAVIAAFIVGGIIVVLIGDNPFLTFYQLVGNSFGSLNDIGYTLFIATPLIFTGCRRPALCRRVCDSMGRN